MKVKGKKQRTHTSPQALGGGVSNALVKELAARIEQYGQNNDHTDVDGVAEYLRRAYPAYQRRPHAQFRKVTEEAVRLVQRRGGPVKPELRLQALEEQHLTRSCTQGLQEDGLPDEEYSGESSSGPELDDEVGADADPSFEGRLLAAMHGSIDGVNSSVKSLYSTPAAAITANRGGAASSASAASLPAAAFATPAITVSAPDAVAATAARVLEPHNGGPGGSAEGNEQLEDDPPAFAAPHLVAAAAARALAADRSGGRAPAASLAAPSAPEYSAPEDTATGIAPQTVAAELDVRRTEALTAVGKEKVAAGQQRSQRRGGIASESGRLPNGKRQRTGSAPRNLSVKPQAVWYADLGGIEGILKDIRELVEYPLRHPEIYAWLRVEPPRGVLLHGPPGCGKTALANAIANECGVPFLRVSAPEIVSGMSGESEAKLRQLFQEAAACAPCIVFIDEIDAIAGKRESAQREMERRIVAQMLTCMDDLAAPRSSPEAADDVETEDSSLVGKHVLVIGATNRPDSLDTALRRAGRFDREIAMGIPSQAARAQILKVLVRKLRLSGDFDFELVATRTPGYVGADLQALAKEAAAVAVARIFGQLQGDIALNGPAIDTVENRLAGPPLSPAELAGLAVTMADFEAAVKKVQPSVRREGFATTPDVTWDDVGSLTEVREELSFAITQPIRNPAKFEALGLLNPTGVLLYGPPGCGKTLLAKAVANESGANFISIKGPELLNKYVGESERAVRQVFSRARAASPCVLFFDEMDALAPRRGSDISQSSERVVNQLLTEMDGVDGRTGVFLIAATNRPDIIDPALLRPGRLDKILYVPLPPPEGRASIVTALTRRTPLAPGVDAASIADSERCAGFSGADLAALVREATICALKESVAQERMGVDQEAQVQVSAHHFEEALHYVAPSVSRKDQRVYDALRSRLRSARAALDQPTPAQSVADGAAPALEPPPEGAAEMEHSTGTAGALQGGYAGGNDEPMDE